MRENLADRVRRVRWFLNSLAGRDRYYRPTTRIDRRIIGRGPAQWVVSTKKITSSSIVYSFGVGANIDFDQDMIDKFGVHVHAFDPSPRSLEWLSNRTLPDQLSIHEYGLSNFDGSITFYPPEDSSHVSYSMARKKSLDGVTLPVKKLSTIMTALGHDRVDILKLDIEGSEYSVIDQLLEEDVSVGQLLVEFHHRFEEHSIEDTSSAIAKLMEAGYDLFYASPRGEEFSFIARS